jgi:translation machinery-associated protein 16
MGSKKITKKALTTKTGPTHPNSRRASQLQRIDLRTSRIHEAKRIRKKDGDAKVEKILSIVFLLPPDVSYVPDMAYLHSFLQSSYLDRHSEELHQLEAERRPGRPTPMALVQLQDRIKREKIEYENGIDIPDLMNEVNVRLLRAWQGDTNQLTLFRFARVSGKDQQQYTIVQKGRHKELVEDDKAQAGK